MTGHVQVPGDTGPDRATTTAGPDRTTTIPIPPRTEGHNDPMESTGEPVMTMPTSGARFIRWHSEHQAASDSILALGILCVGLIGSAQLGGSASSLVDTPWSLTGTVVCVASAVALALRGRLPTVAWLGTAVLPPAWEIVVTLNAPQEAEPVVTASLPMLVGTPFALAAIVKRYPLRWALLALAASLIIAAVNEKILGAFRPGALPLALTLYLLIYLVGVLTGLLNRVHSQQIAEAETRSERLALAREQAALLATANERSRIAREMHDVVAHSLAVMITMADGAAATVERNPAMAKEALGVLAETGRTALADTRRLVGVLRDDPNASSAPPDTPAPQARLAATAKPAAGSGPGTTRPAHSASTPGTGPVPVVRELPVPEFAPPGTVAPVEPSRAIENLRRQATDSSTDASAGQTPTAPAPEQADLSVLVERFKAAGVPITYTWQGPSLPDDKGLQLTLFRIAQEALTNVLRYAPTTRTVSVTVDRHRGTAVLTIDNEAAFGSTPMHGSGKGLLGMRERAAVYGGSVQAGPTATGWRVRAVLHWDEQEEESSPWQTPQ